MPKGIYERTAECIAKLKGRKLTPAHKANIAASLLGHPVSDATKAKISASCRVNPNRSIRQEGALNPQWNGGRWQDEKGYIRVRCFDHPSATKKGYIREHRLIMEEILGRPLLPEETIHHNNGDKTDNRKENLGLFKTGGEHSSYHQERRKRVRAQNRKGGVSPSIPHAPA